MSAFHDVFDIIGPVMIGPSSSHTAGAARLGRIARRLLGAPAVTAVVELHGSFAKTYLGHGTDKALTAGMLDLPPDDARIRESLELAAQQGLAIVFQPVQLQNVHPNTVRMTLTAQDGASVQVQGSSIGGGNVVVTQIDGMRVELTGEQPTLIVLHRDAPGLIAAVTEVLHRDGVNICSFRLSREEKGGTAVMCMEMDTTPPPKLEHRLAQLDDVLRVTRLDSL